MQIYNNEDLEKIINFPQKYNTLLVNIQSLNNQSFSEKRKAEMIQSIDFIDETFVNTLDIPKTESDSINQKNNREKDKRTNTRENSDNPFHIFTQNIRDLLTDPKWYSEKLAEALVIEFCNLLLSLIKAVLNNELDFSIFYMLVRLLLHFFKND